MLYTFLISPLVLHTLLYCIIKNQQNKKTLKEKPLSAYFWWRLSESNR